MARVARTNTSRTRALVADQPARRAVVPVLLDEGAARRGKSAFRRHFFLRFLLLFLDREGLLFLP